MYLITKMSNYSFNACMVFNMVLCPHIVGTVFHIGMCTHCKCTEGFVALNRGVCCVVNRSVDYHRWYACWCDEACRAGCEGLRPEQLHAGPDRGYWSSNVGDNSQQRCSGAFRGMTNTITHFPRLYSRKMNNFLSSFSLSAGLFSSPLFDGHQGPGPTLLPG